MTDVNRGKANILEDGRQLKSGTRARFSSSSRSGPGEWRRDQRAFESAPKGDQLRSRSSKYADGFPQEWLEIDGQRTAGVEKKLLVIVLSSEISSQAHHQTKRRKALVD